MLFSLSRFTRVASSFLLPTVCVLLLSSSPSSSSSSSSLLSLVSAAPAPSVIAASDPTFVYAPVQVGQGNFQWYCGVSSQGNAANTYTLSFRTIGDAAAVEYVDAHWYIDNAAQPKNARMSNTTLTEFDRSQIVLYSSDVMKFSFTYLSSTTGTAFDTYTYSFTPSKNSIDQVTQIVTPIPGALVTSSQYTVDGFNWKVGIQTYSNVADAVTVEFIADHSAGVSWANLHYMIGNGNSLQNFLMTQNTTQQPADQVIFYQDVTNLPVGELLKFNFTFWNVQDQIAQDSIAFVWSSTSNAVNVIDNIVQNVDSNSLPTSPSGSGSASGSGSGSGSSTSGTTNANSNPNTVYVNYPKNGAAGMMKTSFTAIAGVAAAAVMAACMAIM